MTTTQVHHLFLVQGMTLSCEVDATDEKHAEKLAIGLTPAMARLGCVRIQYIRKTVGRLWPER